MLPHCSEKPCREPGGASLHLWFQHCICREMQCHQCLLCLNSRFFVKRCVVLKMNHFEKK